MSKSELLFCLAFMVAVDGGRVFSFYKCELFASNKTVRSNYSCFIKTLSKTNTSLNIKIQFKRPVYNAKVVFEPFSVTFQSRLFLSRPTLNFSSHKTEAAFVQFLILRDWKSANFWTELIATRLSKEFWNEVTFLISCILALTMWVYVDCYWFLHQTCQGNFDLLDITFSINKRFKPWKGYWKTSLQFYDRLDDTIMNIAYFSKIFDP
jgi:hypothetical protein